MTISVAYPMDTVRFEWFSDKKSAIDKNPDVKLPELYIDKYEPTVCNGTRKSGYIKFLYSTRVNYLNNQILGNFSCLRAVFNLKRDIGFHVAQTYIPTSLALMFSWVRRYYFQLNYIFPAPYRYRARLALFYWPLLALSRPVVDYEIKVKLQNSYSGVLS